MIYIFDLDLTLWDTYNKHGQHIWAKQMLPPYSQDNRIITDDVFSTCTLRPGVKEYLEYLYNQGHKIGFISVGAHWGLPDEEQPSIIMLKKFGIYHYFNYIKHIKYKLYEKTNSIYDIKEKIVFYDDSPKVLDSLKKYDNIIAIDASEIFNWNTLIGTHYD